MLLDGIIIRPTDNGEPSPWTLCQSPSQRRADSYDGESVSVFNNFSDHSSPPVPKIRISRGFWELIIRQADMSRGRGGDNGIETEMCEYKTRESEHQC